MNTTPVVHIGIDVSKDSLSINTGAQDAATIPNTPTDIRKALKEIKRKAGGATAHVCFEATGPYTRALAKECRAAGIPHSVLNPYLVSQFAKSLGAAKTDRNDAQTIRRYADVRNPEPAPEPNASLETLGRLIAAREVHVKAATLFQAQLETVGKTPEAKLLRQTLKTLKAKVAKLDDAIAQAAKADEETAGLVAALDAVTGIGLLTAATVVAHVPEIGTLGRRKAAKLVGLAPFTRQSGRWQGKAFIGGGRKDVRVALFMPATVARQHDPVLKAFYERLIAKGKPYKVALTAVMRKLLCHLEAVARQYRVKRREAQTAG